MRTRIAARGLLLAAAAFAAAPAQAQDQTFSQTIFFGDSLTDSGYFRPLLPANVQAFTGEFTTNPGDVYSEVLARYYDAEALPNGNGQTGTNYAAGGARVNVDVIGPLGFTPSLQTQLSTYLGSTGGTADPDALYTVWGGANDIFTVTSAGADPAVVIPAAVAGQVGIVDALTDAGARYILVPTIPDIGNTPLFRAQGALAQATGTALSVQYNSSLFSAINAADLRVIPLNTFGLISEVLANPLAFGFSNTTGTACTPQITANSLTCNPTSYATPNAANDYVFADGVHPTTAAHRITAQYAISVIEAPRQMQQLPHAAAITGRSLAERVAGHVGGGEAAGLRLWGSGRFDSQGNDAMDNRGPALLLGLDWKTGPFTAGVFGGLGRTRLDFGAAGESRQRALTGGLFAGYSSSFLWGNAQLSWTDLDHKVERRIALGSATRVHEGSPGGRNFTAALQVGANLGSGGLTHGPVASLIAQKVRVNGFDEDQGELSTALSYERQKYNSLLGSLGYQASYALEENVRPYLRATYDRELNDVERDAFARLQTIDTQPYAVPGLEWDRSYGTVTGGIRTVFAGIDANVGASVTVGRGEGQDVSAFLTLGRAF